MEAAHVLSSPLGKITISSDVVAHIVGHTVAECYGVVGTGARGPVGRLLARDAATHGVTVREDGGRVAIGVQVVVEYGLNLAEVASSVRSRVSYEVERLTGLTVASVEVHVRDVRQPA